MGFWRIAALAAFIWAGADFSPVLAQGCGSANPNCIVPTRPVGDNTNSAASTAFVSKTGMDGANYANAQAAADANQGKIFTVTQGATVTVSVPSQQPTIQAALLAIAKWTIPQGAITLTGYQAGAQTGSLVVISVAPGTYNVSDTITVAHPDGMRIAIRSSVSTYTYSVGGGGAITISSAVAGDYRMNITLTSVTNLAVGDYLRIACFTGVASSPCGTGDWMAILGYHKITAIVGNVVTIKNKNGMAAAQLTALTLNTTGNTPFIDRKPVQLKATATLTPIVDVWPMLEIASGFSLGAIGGIGLIGDDLAFSPSGTLGIRVYYSAHLESDSGGGAFGSIGIADFTRDCVWAYDQSQFLAFGVVASGCGEHGFYAIQSADIQAVKSIATGMGSNGFAANDGASIICGSCISSGNAVDFYANNRGLIVGDNTQGYGTATGGVVYRAIGATIRAVAATASKGQTCFLSENGGEIDVTSATIPIPCISIQYSPAYNGTTVRNIMSANGGVIRDSTAPSFSLSAALGVASGGTGLATATLGTVVTGNGTSAMVAVGPGTSGQVLTSQGAGVSPVFATAAAGALTLIRTDIFTANGTFTKGASDKLYHVVCQGGGGGGGSGRRSTAGVQAGGGAGGDPGTYIETWRSAAEFGATAVITITTGGGGAVAAADSTNGAIGTAGGSGLVTGIVSCPGGAAGGGGTNAAGGAVPGGGLYHYPYIQVKGGVGGASGAGVNATVNGTANSSPNGPAAGAGAPGITTANVETAGTQGQSSWSQFVAQTGAQGALGAICANGGNGGAPSGNFGTGGGGGSGGSCISAAAGNGGNGGFPGGGAAGGAGGRDTFGGGAGGNGGAVQIVIQVWG